jgi:TonB family protein
MTHSLLWARLIVAVAALCISQPLLIRAQQPALPEGSTSIQASHYPDSAAGLRQLAIDFIAAAQRNDSSVATAIARSMILPDSARFYHDTFGNFSSDKEIASYEHDRSQLPAVLVAFFKKGAGTKASKIVAKRFEVSCDDSDGEDTFSILSARVNNTPLYDLRLLLGDKYLRLWPVAYTDGGFRYVGEPHPWEYFKPSDAALVRAEGEQNQFPGATDVIPRITVEQRVAAAKLNSTALPRYPSEAKHARIAGAVTMHALIAPDGSISQLRVMKGYCSLAEASVAAVRQWHYLSTPIDNKPAEVDTTIEVIYSLSY